MTMRGASSSLLRRALSGAAKAARRSDSAFSSIEASSASSSSATSLSLLARARAPLASRSFAASSPQLPSEDDDSSAREGRFAFVDRVRLCAVGGAGGPGCSAFWKNRNGRGAYGPPDGGHGGAGGDVVLVACAGTKSLRGIRPKLRASRGAPGGPAKRAGARGRDRVVPVPLGTRVFAIDEGGGGGRGGGGGGGGTGREDDGEDDASDDDNGGEEEGEENPRQRRQQRRRRPDPPSVLAADLSAAGQRFVAAAGGRGGAGNASVPRAQLSAAGSLPSAARASPGEHGEARLLRLELASLADVGLVGPPNAGKSTLLRRLTGARPEVGAYAFTTRRPHLGVLLPFSSPSACSLSKSKPTPLSEGENGGERPPPLSPSGNPFLQAAIAASEEDASLSPSSSSSNSSISGSITVADVPGLLPGAGSARGTGLGHEFLRHVSRCSALAVVVDASGDFALQGGKPRTPREQYEGIVAELRAYDEALSSAERRGGGGTEKRTRWREEEGGEEAWNGVVGGPSGSDSPSNEPPLGGLASAARRAIVIATKCDLAPDGGTSALLELREAVRSERRKGRKGEERERKRGGDGVGDEEEEGEGEGEEEEEIVVVAASGRTGEGITDVARALREAVRSSSGRGGGRKG